MGLQGIMLVQLTLIGLLLASMAAAAVAQAKPGCPDRCGNVSIPYPFGTKKDCNHSQHFLLYCNDSVVPPKLTLGLNVHVVSISLKLGELKILNFLGRDCYNSSGGLVFNNDPMLRSGPGYTISGRRNKFTAVGCDTYAIVRAYKGQERYTTGCMSVCDSITNVKNGSCSGIGCCETSIPEGTTNFTVKLSSYNNHTSVRAFNPCSYAFVVEETHFKFSSNQFRDLNNTEYLPVVLDWRIGKERCKAARKTETYACQGKSECYEPDDWSGYLCKCLDGYHGNPYLPDGCQDINECDDPSLNKCVKKGRCKNTPGNYTCSCPKGYHGDGRQDGDRCNLDHLQVISVVLGAGIGFMILLLIISWLYWGLKKRKFIKLKEKFFQQNGGLMLQQQLSRQEGSDETIKIFTAEELEKATNKYDESNIVGRGGYGTVYKGTLTNGRIVAVKKSKMIDKSQIEQFINEVLVLSQINHRNVVKLLGCCLETEVPLLVYEFITNGTLFNYIHGERKASTISWEVRLRIATETAGVLSYLHSATSTPIIHRDVKSTNILLDDNYTAKVSDFGASRLVPLDQTQLSTLVQGTLGYLDPEYLLTSQLTEKSDVYSFGVVFVELLTGEKALSFDRSEEERSLAMYFLSSCRDDNLFQVLDKRIVNEENIEQLKEAANLAKRCLRLKGDERPTMKEVAMELERMRMMEKHAWIDSKEKEQLHGESSKAYDNDCSFGFTSASFGSLGVPMNDGR
ncbi:hypothetical protein PVL29_023201 [Vitis rotundifolia]|uniref:Uncharacterized protein n=1 Tax=Vitis rotundifolia TaxID=103349 RepID=A0AA39D723_VITRO|nr:hypothetical protein PVL29_023201 [Vitis rotundifolia]